MNSKVLSRALTMIDTTFWAVALVAVLGWAFLSCGGHDQDDGPSSGAAAPREEYSTALTPDGRGIVRRPAPSTWKPVAIDALPVYNPANRNSFQVDLRRRNVGALDLQGRLADLLKADFDTATRWPARLPTGFDTALIMDLGRNPGLGIRALHKEGITGKGAGIAILDQSLLVDHVEYKDRLRLYEEIHCRDERASMHGAALASIAVGKSVGVAPGADLYFIGETSGTLGRAGFDYDFTHLARAINRILEINRRLPAAEKIRVIAIAQGWSSQRKGHAEATRAVEKAGREGVFVVSSSLLETSGQRFAFHGLGREPMADPEDPRSFGPGLWWTDAFYSAKYRTSPDIEPLLVPMDSRTTAGPGGPEDYAFYRQGGWSWSIPWIAGLYALACQARPDVTPELFWTTALATGDGFEFPPREKPLTQEEIEKRVPPAVEKVMARVQAGLKGRSEGVDPEKYLAEFYNYFTGKKVGRMSEAEFRAWETGLARERLSAIGKPVVLEKIVNPAKLIAALRK